MVVGPKRDRNIRVPQQFRHDFHTVPGAQHRGCHRVAEVVPPAQVDVELLRHRADVALQCIARIQRNATACMEDPLAGFPPELSNARGVRVESEFGDSNPALGGMLRKLIGAGSSFALWK